MLGFPKASSGCKLLVLSRPESRQRATWRGLFWSDSCVHVPVMGSDQHGDIARWEAISTVGVVTAGLAIGIVEEATAAAPSASENTVHLS